MHILHATIISMSYIGMVSHVAGHSLGGGAAALTALLLRKDERLSMHHRAHLRAVCLAPAAVMNKALALACQPFVTTIVWSELWTHTSHCLLP